MSEMWEMLSYSFTWHCANVLRRESGITKGIVQNLRQDPVEIGWPAKRVKDMIYCIHFSQPQLRTELVWCVTGPGQRTRGWFVMSKLVSEVALVRDGVGRIS